MESTFLFVLNSVLLGAGLAMDAFSVCVANGLAMAGMRPGLRRMMPVTFALFQFAMPLIGWVCVRTVAGIFRSFARAIPWIALLLLGFIGGRMLAENLRRRGDDAQAPTGFGVDTLLVQGVATSIDALSAGFTIADYRFPAALAASGIIAAVTWALCACGLAIARRIGANLADRAGILGGTILIAIGVEIFLRGAL